jgi:uroporphyrinogen decarboxylase
MIKSKKISERDNFLRAIEFRNPEWIPLMVDLSTGPWAKYGNKLSQVIDNHRFVSGNQHIGLEPLEIKDPTYIEGVIYRDDWGCLWQNCKGGMLGRVIEHPLADWKAFDKFLPPDPLDQFNWAGLRQITEENRQRGLLTKAEPEMFCQIGFFDRLSFLRGYENLMMDLIEEPPQLHKLIDLLLEYNLKYIRKWMEIGVDIFWHHGDIGSQKGLMFDPEVFRKYFKPAYRQMFQTCRKAGCHVWYSSDGNLLEIVEDLVECGVSMHDPQVRANTIESIQKHYKGKLCAAVDIDEQLLPFCSPEEIHQQIKEVVEKVACDEGGLIIYAIPSKDVPLTNIEAIFTGWEKYCC